MHGAARFTAAMHFIVTGDVGVSFVFPLFIVKNYSDPPAGGWLVNRIYLMDGGLRDFGYGVLYSTSASRWIDGYASIGYERDKADDGSARRYWVGETGLKFRAKHRALAAPLPVQADGLPGSTRRRQG